MKNKAARADHPAPPLPRYCNPYLIALRTLKGDRFNSTQGFLNPIPFTAIERYAVRFVRPQDFEQFVDLMMAIDESFIDKRNKQIQKRMEQNGRHQNNSRNR